MSHIRISTIVACGVGVLLYSGCVKPYPHMQVNSAVRVDVLDEMLQDEADGVQVYDRTSTVGLFPTGVSVVRITDDAHALREMIVQSDPSRDGEIAAQSLPMLAGYKPGVPGSDPHLSIEYTLFPLRGFEATYWMELFDSTVEVREVVLLHTKSVRKPLTSLTELQRVSKGLDAGVMLVYGFDNTSIPDACRVVGLIYDVTTNRLVARIQHTATLQDSTRAALDLREEERPVEPRDWKFYTDEVAFRNFEKLFRQTIWEMADRDMPPSGQETNPYENARPPYRFNAPFFIDPAAIGGFDPKR